MAKRKTERAVSTALRAIRSAFRPVARNVARRIIARGDEAKPIASRYRQGIKRNVRALIADQYRGRDAPVKVAAAESLIAAAGGNRAVARAQARERNEFGKTLAQELQGARNKLLRRINRIVDDGVRRGRTRREIADEVADVVARNYATKRVVAWHATRAANRAEEERLKGRGVREFVIMPSPSHPRPDVCDRHFGRHPMPYPLPPYHPFCTCMIAEP